jgi:hypothetical protein
LAVSTIALTSSTVNCGASPGLGVAQHAAGGGDLDDVAAVLVALAHGLARVVDGIDHALGGAGRADQVRQAVVEPLVGSAWPPVVAMDLPAAQIRGPSAAPG